MKKFTTYFVTNGFLFLLFLSFCLSAAQTSPVSFKVGAIVDMDAWVGKMSNVCMSTAVQDFYAINPHYETRLILHTKDSKDFSTTFVAALELLNVEGVQMIVAPQKSGQAEMVAELGNKSHVPVVSFSATYPSISRNHIPYLISMIQNYTYQFEAIASIIQQYKWKEVVLIYEENDYRNEIICNLIKKLQANNVHIRYRSIISPSASEREIVEELHNLLGIPIRVFIVHMSSSLGRIFFPKAKEVGLMSEGNVWITTEGLTNLLGSMDPSVIVAMRGVIGVKPYVPSSDELDKIRFSIRRKILRETATDGDVSICCLQAYDTIWALAMAAERLFTKHSARKPNREESFGDTGDLRLSDMGPELLKEILDSEFNGLSGKIHLLDGQLQPVAFQIINVVGRGERDIGFWVPKVGISRHPNRTTRPYLRPVVWPGGSTTVPKGWMFLADGKKLKIGYYLMNDFSDFVNVSSDGTLVTGYCIDVFKAVVKALPYVLNYEFVSFRDFRKDGIYTDLKDYDIVVGDITVTANRSVVVDFSIPYTRGGVTMLVPIKYNKIKNLHIVFEAFSWKRWPLQCGLFILIFVIWYLKHVRGSSFLETARTMSLISLLAVIREFQGVNKVTKLIVQIFVFAYLVILMQVFVQVVFYNNHQLTTVDVQDLVRSGDFVGYQKGSFVKVVLKQLGFHESQLKAYNSPEQYGDALEQGSANGGVSAIFDEVPYINSVLEKYCDKYRRGGPLYQMNGFGFVFPRGSPLVSDFSRAISSIVEGEKIELIEKRWLGSKRTCKDPATNKSSNILSYSKSMLLFALLLMLLFMTRTLSLIAHENPESESKLLRLLRWVFAVHHTPNVPSKLQEGTVHAVFNFTYVDEKEDIGSSSSTRCENDVIIDSESPKQPLSSKEIKQVTKNRRPDKSIWRWTRHHTTTVTLEEKESKQ
ncbi:hypothetical protein ACHQM5_029813 [Ranunculus cassubicifolius]